MDYAFNVKKIGDVSPEQLAALRPLAARKFAEPAGVNVAYTPQPDDGYHSRRSIINSQKTAVVPIDSEVASIITNQPWLKPEKLWYYEFNRLDAGKEFHEHTDVKNKNNNGVFVVQVHTVHVPLTGTSTYRFRRDKQNGFVDETMEPGGIYLFNNYIWHKIENHGVEDRINLIMIYRDSQWLAKQAIYEHFEIPRGI
jgi:hypothetical protein